MLKSLGLHRLATSTGLISPEFTGISNLKKYIEKNPNKKSFDVQLRASFRNEESNVFYHIATIDSIEIKRLSDYAKENNIIGDDYNSFNNYVKRQKQENPCRKGEYCPSENDNYLSNIRNDEYIEITCTDNRNFGGKLRNHLNLNEKYHIHCQSDGPLILRPAMTLGNVISYFYMPFGYIKLIPIKKGGIKHRRKPRTNRKRRNSKIIRKPRKTRRISS